MKTAPNAKVTRFRGLITKIEGTLSVKDGQLIARKDGKRRKLPENLEGKDVIVIEESCFNDIIEKRFYNMCS